MIWKPVPGLELESDYDRDTLVVNGVRVAGPYLRSFFAGEIREAHYSIEKRGDELYFTALPCGRPDTETIQWNRELSALRHPAVRAAVQTCGACPDQWEGTLIDGRHFYFRYRSGRASLGIGADPDAAAEDPETARLGHGDAAQGYFDSDEERNGVFERLYQQRIEAKVFSGPWITSPGPYAASVDGKVVGNATLVLGPAGELLGVNIEWAKEVKP
jgi:hypothetical protein